MFEKAPAPILRVSLELATELAKAGIEFVAIPIYYDGDRNLLHSMLNDRINKIEKMCSNDEEKHD